jgi:hypothetical protein
MCVLGVAGAGKTVTQRAVKAALEAQWLQCQAICLTHTGAHNMGLGAMPAHGCVMRHVLHGAFTGQVVVIDEISFAPINLLAALEYPSLKGVFLIFFGDFGQLPPVSNRWRGCNVPRDTFERSNLFWRWSGGAHFVLRRCRRSDQAHFDFTRSLQALEPAKALEAAKARYPSLGGKRVPDWNLNLSNHKRRRINSEMQHDAAAAATEDRVWIDGETPFWCFAGTRLIGCNRALRGIVNGAFLLVTRVSPETVWLQDEDTSGEGLEVSAAQVAKHTRLRWALTLTSGRSLPGTIGIHDTSSRHFSAAHLYVALSRATGGRNLMICE